jgi:hypothetical protein
MLTFGRFLGVNSFGVVEMLLVPADNLEKYKVSNEII